MHIVNPMVQVERFGVLVWEDQITDVLRKEWCLCLRCVRLEGCEIAKEGYDLCCRHNIAFMVTRCPHWTPPSQEEQAIEVAIQAE